MNILNIKNGIIVQQVNCRGVMGGGLALQIRNKWPVVYKEYRNKRKWELGDFQIIGVEPNIWVANVAGQFDFGHNKCHTDYEAWKRVLPKLAKLPRQLYFPYKIGCGLAGGDWDVMLPLIRELTPHAIIVNPEEP